MWNRKGSSPSSEQTLWVQCFTWRLTAGNANNKQLVELAAWKRHSGIVRVDFWTCGLPVHPPMCSMKCCWAILGSNQCTARSCPDLATKKTPAFSESLLLTPVEGKMLLKPNEEYLYPCLVLKENDGGSGNSYDWCCIGNSEGPCAKVAAHTLCTAAQWTLLSSLFMAKARLLPPSFMSFGSLSGFVLLQCKWLLCLVEKKNTLFPTKIWQTGIIAAAQACLMDSASAKWN